MTTTASSPLPEGVDRALWKTVTRLLPVHRHFAEPDGAMRMLTAIAALRDRDTTTQQQLAPTNERFWRHVLLRSFDFTVDEYFAFNVASSGDPIYYTADDRDMVTAIADYDAHQRLVNGDDDDQEDDHHHDDQADDDDSEMDPYDMDDPPVPETLLVEDLQYWHHLGVYFRPSQFDFLGRIQCGETTSEHAWPAHEDAYSLCHDLAMVQRDVAAHAHAFHAPSDGEQSVYAVVLGKMDAAITGRGATLLTHCGFLPHFWNTAEAPVSRPWSGTATEDTADEREEQDETCELFPMGDGRPLDDLQRAVRAWCSDWRHVRVNEEECSSPAFNVGKSRRSTRWLGLVGQRDY